MTTWLTFLIVGFIIFACMEELIYFFVKRSLYGPGKWERAVVSRIGKLKSKQNTEQHSQ